MSSSDSEGESFDDREQNSSNHTKQEEEGNVSTSTLLSKPSGSPLVQGDIMAQQLKFIACLKIVMEELSTLATGFEVDGGQLRYQLYVWLEREVQVLKQLCKYGSDLQADDGSTDHGKHTAPDSTLDNQSTIPTLHEVLIADKMDFEARLSRISRRKKWLQAHQQLLRTLLSYSVLHGACGGGLASIRMELILLLQELQQEKTTQQLQSPLPFPTTLPLLSACVASSKTVIADPIKHLQSNIRDILKTVVQFQSPPVPDRHLNVVFVLRNLSAALSACIYQCLCDSDTFMVTTNEESVNVGMKGFTSCNVTYKDSYLMAGVCKPRKYCSLEALEKPTTPPAKWPGVSSLRGLLASKNASDQPSLNLLLTEGLVSIYISLLIHALAMYDANILYRVASHPFVDSMWPVLFGGGFKKMLRITTDKPPRPPPPDDSLNKQRMKLTMKILGPPSGSSPPTPQPAVKENKTGIREIKPTYKEKFIPPDVSIVSYLMTKPFTDASDIGLEYDSSESLNSSDDEYDPEYQTTTKTNDTAMTEHSDPNSYSWCLIRYALVKYIEESLLEFLPKIGIEMQELPVCSPMLQSVLKTLNKWVEQLHQKLCYFSGPPQDYIPGCSVDVTTNGPTINRYKSLFDPENTPFLSSDKSALAVKRLWYYLVTRDSLKQIFIRFIFKRAKPLTQMDTCRPPVDIATPHDPIKVIHKDQDGVLAFCINQSNPNQINVSTSKELIEMDIKGIMDQPTWLQDQTEYDIENIRCPSPSRLEPEDFLLVSTPDDVNSNILTPESTLSAATAATATTHMKGLHIPGVTNSSYSYYFVDRSRRLMRRLLKRPLAQVRNMAAHPHLPYYLSGSQDGSVRLWEWAQPNCIAVARQPGSFPKVTHVSFNSQGNKFGVSDFEGALCLWQVGLGVTMNTPYLSLKCHNKSMSDFVFVGSSSFLATSGHSSDGKNVCLWDTLLPHRNALVHGFNCHTDGCQALLYAPKHQLILSAGRKGDVCLFDVRQRQMRHTFHAHDSPIRSIALDPTEQFFVTGSDFGDIKVWGLTAHSLLGTYSGEHSKSSIFHKTSSGVSQLYVSEEHLFSCGADGSLKIRRLLDRDVNKHT